MDESNKPNFNKRNGQVLGPLIVAIIQDHNNAEVLVQAFMNQETWDKTIETGLVWLYSTSRNEVYCKGEKTGNTMRVTEYHLDCDSDCLLVVVEVQGDGLACHLGKQSCFRRIFP